MPRKTYKKSMLKAAEDGFQKIVESLVLEAGVDVNTMVPIIYLFDGRSPLRYKQSLTPKLASVVQSKKNIKPF